MTAAAEPGPGALRLLFWESTARCNLACRHCRRLETDQNARELSTEEVRRVLDSAATLGRPLIVFSGGEPLLREDWQTLARRAADLALPTALATNGTLIDEETARRIAAVGFRRAAVSLDGADVKTHDAFRGAPGAFARALQGIRALRQASVPVQINSTIARHNLTQLGQLHELAERVGAVALHLFLLVPVGCGAQIGASHELTAGQYEDVLQWICRQQGGGLEIRATCAPHYYRVAAQQGLDVQGSRGCLCGLSVLFVAHDGEVFPCGYLPVRCGNVRERALAEIWVDSPILADLRDPGRLQGKCGKCEYRAVCGGCRARAFAETGNYLAEEPSCAYAPGTARESR